MGDLFINNYELWNAGTHSARPCLRFVFLEIIHQDGHHPVVGDLVRIVYLTVFQTQLAVSCRSAFILDTERPVLQIIADHRSDAVDVVEVVNPKMYVVDSLNRLSSVPRFFI